MSDKNDKTMWADRPSDDPLTQRYRTALAKLNKAPVGNMTVSDVMWLHGELKRRWTANAREHDLTLPCYTYGDNERTVKRLEALVLKCCPADEAQGDDSSPRLNDHCDIE